MKRGRMLDAGCYDFQWKKKEIYIIIVFITLSLHYHYHHVSVYLFTSGASHIFIDNLLYHSTARALFSASVGS